MDRLEYRVGVDILAYAQCIGFLIFIYFGSYIGFMILLGQVVPGITNTQIADLSGWLAGGFTAALSLFLILKRINDDRKTKIIFDKNQFEAHTGSGSKVIPWDQITKVEQLTRGSSSRGTRATWLEITAPGQPIIKIEADKFPADCFFCMRVVFMNRIPNVTKLQGATYFAIEVSKLVEVGLAFEKWGMLDRADVILRQAVEVACARVPGKGIDAFARPTAQAHNNFLVRNGRPDEAERLYAKYF